MFGLPANKLFKIYRYIAGAKDKSIPPIDINYKTGLIRNIFPERCFVQGELTCVEWYADEDKTDLSALEEYCKSKDIHFIRFLGKTELELLELAPEEREKFKKEMGLAYDLRGDLSKLIMSQLDLVTFITTGDKETKGWYLRSGLSAIEAAGKIHSDMKRGFIRSEVVNFEDFIKCGSMHSARGKGVLKVEGKDYVVKDGDIINVRFNV